MTETKTSIKHTNDAVAKTFNSDQCLTQSISACDHTCQSAKNRALQSSISSAGWLASLPRDLLP